jgi:hypothetical protein
MIVKLTIVEFDQNCKCTPFEGQIHVESPVDFVLENFKNSVFFRFEQTKFTRILHGRSKLTRIYTKKGIFSETARVFYSYFLRGFYRDFVPG